MELRMSQKERDRSKLLAAVVAGGLRQVEAAARLRLSRRQVRRVLERYRAEGGRGAGAPRTRAAVIPAEAGDSQRDHVEFRRDGKGIEVNVRGLPGHEQLLHSRAGGLPPGVGVEPPVLFVVAEAIALTAVPRGILLLVVLSWRAVEVPRGAVGDVVEVVVPGNGNVVRGGVLGPRPVPRPTSDGSRPSWGPKRTRSLDEAGARQRRL